MEINLTNTDIAAWWGAIIATFLLIWDIYKWKTSGPRIKLEASINMKSFNIPDREGKLWIFLTAQNNGSSPTTITNIGFRKYKNTIYKWTKKVDQQFVIANVGAAPDQALPFILNPGCIWQGLAEQTEHIESMIRNNILICDLYCSHQKKPINAQIKKDKIRNAPNGK